MRKHRLKTLAEYFDLSKRRLKPYEIRRNDRLFQAGDIIELYCIRKNFNQKIELRCTDGTWVGWPVYAVTQSTLDKGIAGNMLSLEDFPDNLVADLECIICTVTFVLPGEDQIGLHADHVILSLTVENTRLAPYEDEWSPKPVDPELPFEFPGVTKRPTAAETIAGLKGVGIDLGEYLPEPDPLKEDGVYTGPGYNADFANNPANQIKPAKEYRGSNTPIPKDIVWDQSISDFRSLNPDVALSIDFFAMWYDRRNEFPQTSEAVDPQPELEAIPEGVYYGKIGNNFYSVEDNKGMGIEFWDKWKHRKQEFPQRVEETQNKPKGKVSEETKLLRDATEAPAKGSSNPKGYKPKGFA